MSLELRLADCDGLMILSLPVMLRYVELKSGRGHDGPAWVGPVQLSRSGQTVYFNGRALKRAGAGHAGNYIDSETGDFYWVSGVKKRGMDRHWAGTGKVMIEARAVSEYLELIGETELDLRRFVVSADFVATDPAKFHELENERLE